MTTNNWQMEEAHLTAVRPMSIDEIVEWLEPITDENGNCFDCGDSILTDAMGQRIPTHAPMIEDYEGEPILIQVVCVHCAYMENRPTKVCFQSPMRVVDQTSAGENQPLKQVTEEDADSLENAKAMYAYATGRSNVPPRAPDFGRMLDGRDPMRELGHGRPRLGEGRPQLGDGNPDVGPARPPFLD